MKANIECSSLDIINTLPLAIIVTILCCVPTKDAVRTSILSKKWRYNWVTIPKLVFRWRDMLNKTTYGILDAVHQVLSLHQGPIIEFSLSMMITEDTHAAIDQIISHLVRHSNSLKKFTLDLIASDSFTFSDSTSCLYQLPLSIFSLHQLTDLYVKNCTFDFNPTFSGFRSLKSFYMERQESDKISKKALLRFFCNCPLLKELELVLSDEGIDEPITIIELSKCLPVLEHFSTYRWAVEVSAQDGVLRELPTALVHLKYICLNMIMLFDDYGLGFLGLIIRNSPNLEKIKLDIVDDSFAENDIKLVTLKDCSNIWLEHLKELEIIDFCNIVGEMEFVKLILAKSPELKNVIIVVHNYVSRDEELDILRVLSNSPRASPFVKIIAERRHRY